MEFLHQRYLNYSRDSIWNEASDDSSDENSIAKEVKAMKDPNDIITEQQQEYWDQYIHDYQFRTSEGFLDKQIGVNCAQGFQDQEEKWLPKEIDEAVTELRDKDKWNWRGNFNG